MRPETSKIPHLGCNGSEAAGTYANGILSFDPRQNPQGSGPDYPIRAQCTAPVLLVSSGHGRRPETFGVGMEPD